MPRPMSTWKRQPARVIYGLAAIGFLVALIAIAAIQALTRISPRQQTEVERVGELMADLHHLESLIQSKITLGRTYLLTGDRFLLERRDEVRRRFTAAVDRLATRQPGLAEEARRLAALEQSHEDVAAALVAARSRGPLPRSLQRRVTGELMPRSDALLAAVNSLEDELRGSLAASTLREERISQEVKGRIATISLAGLLLGVAIGLLLVRTLSRLWQAQRQATELIDIERRRYADLVEGLGGVIAWEADPATLDLTFVSPRARRLLRKTTPGLERGQWLERVPAEDRPRVIAALQRASRLTDEQRLEHRLTRDDGRTLWFESAVRSAKGPRGEAVLRGLSIDVTRIRSAEQWLRTHAEQQAAVARLGQRALRGLDIGALAGEATDLVTGVLRLECAAVHTVATGDGGAAVLRLLASRGFATRNPPADASADPSTQLGAPLNGRDLLATDLLAQGGAAADAGSPIRDWLTRHGARGAIAVAIGGEKRPFGVLSACSPAARELSVDDLHFVQAVANVLASAAERQEAERRVRHAEQRFRLLVEGVEDYAIVMLDASGKVESWNPGAQRILGYRAEDAVGRLAQQFFPPEDRERRGRALFEKALREGRAEDEGWLARADGSRFWADVTLGAVHDESGTLVGLAQIARDVTERRESELALRLYATAGEALSGSLDFDRTLEVVAQLAVPSFASGCAVVSFGPLRERIVAAGRDPEMRAAVATLATQSWGALAGGIAKRTPPAGAKLAVLDGALRARLTPEAQQSAERLRLTTALAAPLTARGRALGVLLFFSTEQERRFDRRDGLVATELARRAGLALENARLYRESQNAIRARDEFLAVASHELKTPLTSFRLQVQNLLRQARRRMATEPSYGPLQPRLELLDRQSARLAKLVGNIIDISLIAAGTMPMNLERIDLAELVQDVVRRREGDLRRSGCPIELHLEEPAVGVFDRRRLEQVLGNLLDNAIVFGAGKPVEVRLEVSGATARLTVRDQGIGIREEDGARIFERFERAVSDRHYGGLGMGLWIVRNIVVALGGEIEVKSRPGEGSAFAVTLPVLPQTARGVLAGPSPSPAV